MRPGTGRGEAPAGWGANVRPWKPSTLVVGVPNIGHGTASCRVRAGTHKAMEGRIARTASRHGLDVQTAAPSEDARLTTDVLVTAAGGASGGRLSTPPSPPAAYADAPPRLAPATSHPCG